MNLTLLVSKLINLGLLFKQKKLLRLVICISIGLFVSLVSSGQTRYYVNQSVITSGDGKSWGAAFKTLSEGIKAASSNVADEIWVAKGTYYPDTNPYGTRYVPPSYSRNMTFFLKKPVQIYGGFTGNESTISQRDWENNETILSGNIRDLEDSTDNIYHVMLIMGTEASPLENVTVDGFTIRDGYANVITSLAVDGNEIYAYNGGGIYNLYASPELKNLKITRNVGFVGGGIHNNHSSTVIDNCQILKNYSGADGGGIYNLSGSPVIRNTLIEGNYVNNEGGGGIENRSSNATIQHTIIRNNRASKGGGIYNTGSNVILENVIIENNNGNIDGGGIYNFSETNLYMKHVAITGNQSTFGGGINSFRAKLQIDSSQIRNNTASQYGGGIYSDGDTIQIRFSNIDTNKTVSYQGGGLFVSESVINIKGGTIKGNEAKTDAGGMLLRYDAQGIFEEVEFRNNKSLRYGGGIYLFGNSDTSRQSQFKKVTFNGNTAFAGGGMYLNGTSPKLNDVDFNNNTTTDAGAGLMVASFANPELLNCRFEKNTAASGGGMFTHSSAFPVLNSVLFSQNEAANYGGSFYIDGPGNFNSLILRGNKAREGGGAYLSGDVNITNALIAGNYASERGGGIYIDRAIPVLTNNTMSGNNALLSGGGIYADNSGNAKFRNTIIYGNSSGLGFVNGLPKFSYSFVEGRTDATNGNIPGSVDPQFTESYPYTDAPFINGNFMLKVNSPVIDKGDNSVYQPGSIPELSAITTDLAGNSRFYNTIIDIGSFEYQPGILPLKLVLFQASLKNNTVEVSWKTMHEVNVSHFVIERSADAISFTKVGIQPANGSGAYHFTDINLPAGITYYRLKMVDKDGHTEYSAVRSVKILSFGASAIVMYPNPSNGLVYITYRNNTALKVLFRVQDALGKTVLQTYSNPLDIHSLVPGLYYISIADKAGKVIGTKSIIKH